MKKIFFIISLLVYFIAEGQIYQGPTLFGKIENRFGVYYNLWIPNDTIAPPVAYQNRPHIAAKGDSIYLWSTSQLKFILYSGSSGTVTNVATGLWLSGGPITTTGTIIADSASMAAYFLRRKDSAVSYTTPTWVTNAIAGISGSYIKTAGTSTLTNNVLVSTGTNEFQIQQDASNYLKFDEGYLEFLGTSDTYSSFIQANPGTGFYAIAQNTATPGLYGQVSAENTASNVELISPRGTTGLHNGDNGTKSYSLLAVGNPYMGMYFESTDGGKLYLGKGSATNNTSLHGLRIFNNDSMSLQPPLGRLNIDTLRSWTDVSDTLYKKPMTWDIRNGRWEYLEYWPGGGGGGSGTVNAGAANKFAWYPSAASAVDDLSWITINDTNHDLTLDNTAGNNNAIYFAEGGTAKGSIGWDGTAGTYTLGAASGVNLTIETSSANIVLDPSGGAVKVVGAATDNTATNVYAEDASGNVVKRTVASLDAGYTNLTQFVAQTAHRLFYSDANGDVQELAFGAAGTTLNGNGTTSAPSFGAPFTLTTTGSSGAATYSGGTLNIPNYGSGGATWNGVISTTNAQATGYTMAGEQQAIFTGSSPATFTLPVYLANRAYWVKNKGTATLTVASNEGTTNINGAAGAVSTYDIPAGESRIFLSGSSAWNVYSEPGTGGSVSDGDKGDIVVSGSGATWDIDAGVIVNADINASAAIDATKLIDGSITNTELGYINTLTSNAQTQIDGKQASDADLTTIAGLTATTNNFMVAQSSAWESVTPTTATSLLNAFVGDAGSGGTKGLVPAPATGDASKYLKGDGTWATIAAGGDVVGPASSTDNSLAIFDGTTGKLLESDAGFTVNNTNDWLTAGNIVSGTWQPNSDYGFVGSSQVDQTAAGNYTFLIQKTTGETFVNVPASQLLGFRQNNTDRLVITSSGEVWMGVIARIDYGNYQLQVAGNIFSAGLIEGVSFFKTAEIATPSTPATGTALIYPKADGNWYTLDDAGSEKMATNTGSLSQFSATTSAELAGVISDETGSGALVFGTSPNFTTGATIGGVAIPTISSTNTLTNKRITARTGTTTSSATPTINTDNVDFYSLTAQAVDITSFTTNLSGTPTEGQKLWIAITGTAARAITWGASFEASTVALPTTTVTTNRLDVGFVWNSVTSRWRCVAVQ